MFRHAGAEKTKDGCNNRMTPSHSTNFELLFKNQMLELRKCIVDEQFQKFSSKWRKITKPFDRKCKQTWNEVKRGRNQLHNLIHIRNGRRENLYLVHYHGYNIS